MTRLCTAIESRVSVRIENCVVMPQTMWKHMGSESRVQMEIATRAAMADGMRMEKPLLMPYEMAIGKHVGMRVRK